MKIKIQTHKTNAIKNIVADKDVYLNYKQNLHIHTTYVDGKDSLEEMVIEAIHKGFGSIGFSEHTYLQYSSFPNQLTNDKIELYKKEIKQLKNKYKDKIDIFCGLEYDFYSEINTDDFDYLIGSVHYIDCNRYLFGKKLQAN